MSVFEVIKRRRSIGQMAQERPTRAQIEQILEAATHAPNHHNVEPWKFLVLAGTVREKLGAVMAESLSARLDETVSEKAAQAMLEKERRRFLRSFPAVSRSERNPTPFEKKTTWLGWEA